MEGILNILPDEVKSGIPAELVGHEALKGYEDINSLLQSHIDLKTKPVDYTANMSEEDKALMKVKGWKTPLDGFKGYRELEKFVGYEKIPAPKKDAQGNYLPGEFERVMGSLGLPKDTKGYEVDKSFQLPVDQVKLDIIKQEALKAGVLPQHFKFMMNEFNKVVQDSQKIMTEQEQIKYNQAMVELRGKWGVAFPEKQNTASKILSEFGGDKAQELVKKYGNDPLVIELLANVGANMSEEAINRVNLSGNMLTPSVAKAQIATLQAEHAAELLNANHPQHKYYVDKYTELHRMASV